MNTLRRSRILTITIVALTALVAVSVLVQCISDNGYTPTVTPTSLTACSQSIVLTHIPPLGGSDILEGLVECVDPASYQVAVYIYVYGWWTKPYAAEPTVPIADDGTWAVDIVTGGMDEQATRIAAFLLPQDYSPMLASGEQELPEELFQNMVSYTIEYRQPELRRIRFSGYEWYVKRSVSQVGPGPNYFSDDPGNVWVDDAGHLHMTISQVSGLWRCTEVWTSESLGYGTYTFTLGSDIDQLDRNVILGLFTWDDNAPQHNYREIDIEITRWGDEGADNAQYVVQPWDISGNLFRFDSTGLGDRSTHVFSWTGESIRFFSYRGHAPTLEEPFATWTYTGADLPPAGGENTRVNLWLMEGLPPSDGREVEVVIETFEFSPEMD